MHAFRHLVQLAQSNRCHCTAWGARALPGLAPASTGEGLMLYTERFHLDRSANFYREADLVRGCTS